MQSAFAQSQALIERTSQVVFSYDIASGLFTYLNPAFEDVFQKRRASAADPAALLGMVHPDDLQHLEEKYTQVLRGDILKNVEFRILLPNSSERWLCLTPFLLEDAPGQISGFAEDITSSKHYSLYLKKYSDKKNSVLNILSHDLAGPLAMISSLSDMLADDLKHHDNGEVHKVIDLIGRSSQQGTRLIQEFISKEFLESTNTGVIKRRVDVVGRIRHSMEEYQQNEKEADKNFRFTAPAESVYMELDDNKFMQVINNLVSNSIKFTSDGGTITVGVKEEQASVLFTVEDTGVGIPEKYHATLFEKFSDARRSGLKGEPSVGLGMSIIKTIVDWHSGEIWFESQENKGTTFYIRLPKI